MLILLPFFGSNFTFFVFRFFLFLFIKFILPFLETLTVIQSGDVLALEYKP